MRCPACGDRVSTAAKFCGKCGYSLVPARMEYPTVANITQAKTNYPTVATITQVKTDIATDTSIAAPALEYAEFMARFGAYFWDGVILGFISIILVFTMSLLAAMMDLVLIMILLSAVMYPVFILGYFTYFESSDKQATIGKQMAKIRVVDASGNRLSWQRALVRAVLKLMSVLLIWAFLLGLVSFLTAVVTPKKQTIYDMIVGTYVVYGKPYGKPAAAPVAPAVLQPVQVIK